MAIILTIHVAVMCVVGKSGGKGEEGWERFPI